MSRVIEYRAESGLVVVKTSGIYQLDKEIATVRKAIAKMNEHCCEKCLFDHREAKVIAKMMESYYRSERYLEVGLKRSMRVASLVKKISPDLKFYENAAVNRGWDVGVFDDYDAAIDWLNR